MTLGEIALWREIKGKKLGVRFNRQIPIGNYIVDFYCKDLQLAIEVDGSIHFEEEHQEMDKLRQNKLKSFGLYILRFSDHDVKNNLGWILDEIKGEIKKIGPTPNPSQEGNCKAALPRGE